jgi:mannosyltransferase OCH1-like enzyme
MGVPAVVHHIWFNFREWGRVQAVPARYDEPMASWLRTNPGYRRLIWNEPMAEELMRCHYPRWLERFHSLPLPIQRADFFRWVALFHFGGIYADVDCSCQRAIAPLIDRGKSQSLLLLSKGSMTLNALIIATPRHPAVAAIIAGLGPLNRALGAESAFGVFHSTGPAAVQAALDAWQAAGGHEGAVVVEAKLMWNGQKKDADPSSRSFFAAHTCDGAWGYDRMLAFDIVRIIAAVVIVLLALALLAFFVRQRWRKPPPPFAPNFNPTSIVI